MSTLFDRTIDILKYIAAQGGHAGVTQLANALDIPKSSVSRMLSMLAGHDYVRKRNDGRYIIGPGALLLYAGFRAQDSLVKASRSYIESLAQLVDQSVLVLSYTVSGRLYVADELPVPGSIKTPALLLGQIADMTCTAAGKAILMHLPENELAAFFSQATFTRRTQASVRDEQELRNQLIFFHKRGFAEDTGENSPDASAVAAAVLDAAGSPVGCICVLSSSYLKNRTAMMRAGRLVVETARQVSGKMQETRPKARL